MTEVIANVGTHFVAAQNKRTRTDLTRRQVLYEVGQNQRTQWELLVGESGNLQSLAHRTDVPAVDIYRHKVELIETGPQRANLLMDGRAMEPLFEWRVRNILRTRVRAHP